MRLSSSSELWPPRGPEIRIAAAQIAPVVGDLEGNVELAERAVREASTQHADLVVLPELAIPGIPPRDLLRDASFIEAIQAATEDLASRVCQLSPTLVGTVVPSRQERREHPALWNVAALLDGGRVERVFAKQLLPGYDVFHEARWFLPGPPSSILEIAGRRLGVLICEDLWGDGGPIRPVEEARALGAEALITLAASPFRRGILARRLEVAAASGLPTLLVNAVGATDELIFDGRSFLWDPALGEASPRLPGFREDVEVFDLPHGSTDLDHDTSDPELADRIAASNPDGPAEVFAALSLGLRDFVRRNRVSSVILGLSGGIDSALAAVLAVDAVGPGNVRALALPSRHTDPRSTESARELAENLGFELEVLPIEAMHGVAESALGPLEGTAAENVQARLRMLALTSRLDRDGGLLLGTANKTELTLGYTTLYGDHAGTLLPLGDLTKVEVVEVARWWNDHHPGSTPPFILHRAPTAELRPDQVDPFDYAAIAPRLETLVRSDRSDGRMRRAEHKRWQAGVILKVSERAFGTGRLVPVTRR